MDCIHCVRKCDLVNCKKEICGVHNTWYAQEQQKIIDKLTDALKHAQSDINWMINERTFLNQFVFDYIEETLKEAK